MGEVPDTRYFRDLTESKRIQLINKLKAGSTTLESKRREGVPTSEARNHHFNNNREL